MMNTALNTPLNTDYLPTAIVSNEPQKLQSSSHVLQLCGTIYLLISIGVGVYLLESNVSNVDDDYSWLPYFLMGQGYFFYIIMVTCCNKTLRYLSNVNSHQFYEDVYYKVKNAPGYFVFHVQCYHYEDRIEYVSVTDANGNKRQEMRTHRDKVVTHNYTENLYPAVSEDLSGHIEGILQEKSIVFMRYDSNYLFFDQRSKFIFDGAFENFKRNNNRDVHQDASYRFQIPGFVERLAFFTKEPIGIGMFVFFAIFGLAYPYAICFEKKVARYRVSITKRITL